MSFILDRKSLYQLMRFFFLLFLFSVMVITPKFSQPTNLSDLICTIEDLDSNQIINAYSNLDTISSSYHYIGAALALVKNDEYQFLKLGGELLRTDSADILINYLYSEYSNFLLKQGDYINSGIIGQQIIDRIRREKHSLHCQNQLKNIAITNSLSNVCVSLGYQGFFHEAELKFKNLYHNLDHTTSSFRRLVSNYILCLIYQKKYGEALINSTWYSKLAEKEEDYYDLYDSYLLSSWLYTNLDLKEEASKTIHKIKSLPTGIVEVSKLLQFEFEEAAKSGKYKEAKRIATDFLMQTTNNLDSTDMLSQMMSITQSLQELDSLYRIVQSRKSDEGRENYGLYISHEAYYIKKSDLGLINEEDVKKMVSILNEGLHGDYNFKTMVELLLEYHEYINPAQLSIENLRHVQDSITNFQNNALLHFIEHKNEAVKKRMPYSITFFTSFMLALLAIIGSLIVYKKRNNKINLNKLQFYYRSISHDIKFPLEKLEYLIKNKKAEEALNSLDEVKFTIQNLINLFAEQDDREEKNDNRKFVSIQPIVDNAIQNLTHPKKLKTRFDIELNEFHNVNTPLIYHLLLNAIHNGLKHSNSENPIIKIRDYKSSKQSHLIIENSLSSAIDLNEINDKMIKLSIDNSYGFGLHIIKAIADKMGGEVTFSKGNNSLILTFSIQA